MSDLIVNPKVISIALLSFIFFMGLFLLTFVLRLMTLKMKTKLIKQAQREAQEQTKQMKQMKQTKNTGKTGRQTEDNEQANKEQSYLHKKENDIEGTISHLSHNPSPDYREKTALMAYDIGAKQAVLQQSDAFLSDAVEHFVQVPRTYSYDHYDYDVFSDKNSTRKTSMPFVFRSNNIRVYLINMDKSIDRLERFRNTLAKSDLKNVSFERISAINGKALNLKPLLSKRSYDRLLKTEKKGYRLYHYELTRGAVGCYLSHMKAYEKIIQQKEDIAFIFEDDVKLVRPNILEEMNDVLPMIPADWDILNLGCLCFVCGKFNAYYDANRFFLMHAYIVRKSTASKLLHLLEKRPITQQIDAQYSDFAEKGMMKYYCLRDKLAVQYDMGTNIQIPVKNVDGINPFDSLETSL